MGHHIDSDGRFQSDKHSELPPDRIRLNFEAPASQRALWVLAEDYDDVDPGLSDDIRARLTALGYTGRGKMPLDQVVRRFERTVDKLNEMAPALKALLRGDDA